MINLTKQERVILIFLGFALLFGIGLQACFKTMPGLKRIVYGDIASKKNSAFKVDINSADSNELVRIRGVGSVLAARIIDYRKLHGPFSDIKDIINVRGIGKLKFSWIKDFIKVD